MSISMSFSGLVPSRGAYLFSSSSTTTESGRRWPGLLLLAERLVQQRADDEPLRLLVQRLDRDDGDARRRAIDPAALAGPDELAHPRGAGVQPPHERGDRAGQHPAAPRPVRLGAVLRLQELAERVDEREQVGDDPFAGLRLDLLAAPVPVGCVARIAQHDRARHPHDVDGEPLQLRLDALADERDLVLRVVRVGEQELQAVLVDELARRPAEDVDPLVPSAGVGDDDVTGALAAPAPRTAPTGTARARRRASPTPRPRPRRRSGSACRARAGPRPSR